MIKIKTITKEVSIDVSDGNDTINILVELDYADKTFTVKYPYSCNTGDNVEFYNEDMSTAKLKLRALTVAIEYADKEFYFVEKKNVRIKLSDTDRGLYSLYEENNVLLEGEFGSIDKAIDYADKKSWFVVED